jgi:CBS domain containing-hemolysin-like protein
LHLAAVVVLILFSAFFNGSEAALYSLGRASVSRLEKRSPAGRRVASLLRRPRRLLITILIGNLVANVFASSQATSLAMGIFGEKGVGVAFVVMSATILAVGEIFPKVLAINHATVVSMLVAYPLSVLHFLFTPFRWPMARFSDIILDFIKRRLGAAVRHFSKDEILTALEVGRDAGHFGEFEYELLSNIMEFRETTVKEIMTPSINVFSLPSSMSAEDLLDQVMRSGYSRAPLYGEAMDDIKGFVHIKDLARVTREEEDLDVSSILMHPYYVPESAKISFLFNELARERLHIALVIDEYGSFVGIVTMEDILEEIVGEIRDEKEPVTSAYTMMPDGRIVVAGTMEIEDFNEVFKTSIVDDEHETIAGYVMGATGKIPSAGETIDIGALRFHVISAQPNRIRKMRVEKL